jgi:outer membrane immunogenic protein
LPASAGFDPSKSTGSEDLRWFGTVRGRIGITATPNLLIYGTGGLAYGRITDTGTLVYTPPVDGNYSGSTSDTRTGWVAGGGAEYAWSDKWSTKIEYLYHDLGTTTVREMDPRSSTSFIDYKFEHRDQIVRFSLNYKFGGDRYEPLK